MTDFNDSLDDLFGMQPGRTAPVAQRALPVDFESTRAAAPVFEEQCPKCKGSGRFISYSGRDCGPCFTCKGAGKRIFKTSTESRERSRATAQARKDRQADANVADFAARYPNEAKWIEEKTATFGFASAMRDAVLRWGDLTPAQLAAVQKCIARDEEREAARQARADAAVVQARQAVAAIAPSAPAIDVANIVELFDRAQKAGLKRFTLRFDGVHFQGDRNDPKVIWVSQAGYGTARFGRIVQGVYRPGRDTSAATIAKIVEISADPLAAGIAYAQLTSSCAVCGRHLENQDSVDAGIGPICAGRLNRPGLKFVPAVAGEDF